MKPTSRWQKGRGRPVFLVRTIRQAFKYFTPFSEEELRTIQPHVHPRSKRSG